MPLYCSAYLSLDIGLHDLVVRQFHCEVEHGEAQRCTDSDVSSSAEQELRQPAVSEQHNDRNQHLHNLTTGKPSRCKIKFILIFLTLGAGSFQMLGRYYRLSKFKPWHV